MSGWANGKRDYGNGWTAEAMKGRYKLRFKHITFDHRNGGAAPERMQAECDVMQRRLASARLRCLRTPGADWERAMYHEWDAG